MAGLADRDTSQPTLNRRGQKWSDEERTELTNAFQSGVTIPKIAQQHGRTRNAIKSQLAHLGLIEFNGNVTNGAGTNMTTHQEPKPDQPIAPLSDKLLRLIRESQASVEYVPIAMSENDLNPLQLEKAGLISLRLKNVLWNYGFSNISDAFHLQPGVLLKFSNFGRKTLRELQAFCEEHFTIRPIGEPLPNGTTQPKEPLADQITALQKSVQELDRVTVNKEDLSEDELRESIGQVKSLKSKLRIIEKRLVVESVRFEEKTVDNEPIEQNGTNAQRLLELLDLAIEACGKDARDANILKLRLGMKAEYPALTLKEIGEIYGVTRERIRQIEKRVDKRLKHYLSRADQFASNEFRRICTGMFIGQPEEPLDLIIDFTQRFYGQTIAQHQVTLYIAHATRLYDDQKLSKAAVYQKYASSLAASKAETEAMLKDGKALARWARIFCQVSYPPEQQFFQERIPGLETRLRDPNEDSNGQTGSFFSHKCNRDILYESIEEYRLYQILEKSDKIVWYQEQPIAIPYMIDKRLCHYYPDVAVLTDEGRGAIIEVKGPLGMISQATLRKASAAIKHLHASGLGYVMCSAQGASLNTLSKTDYDQCLGNALLDLIDRKGSIRYRQYKNIVDERPFSVRELVSFIVRNNLSFAQYPFRINKMPPDLSFQRLLQ